jgi:hypothetical protein
MPESKGASCESYREQLIELLLESKAKAVDTARVPGPLGDHLAACASCWSFWATLNGLQPAFALPDLYTAGLKYRTLKCLAAEAESEDERFLGLMIPISFVSLLFWFAIPLFLLTWLLDYWLSQPWVSLLLSAFLLTSLGFLLGLLAFVAVGRGKGAEQLKGRMKDLLEGFHA